MVETMPTPGTEQTTARVGQLREQAGEVFSRIQDVIVGVAVSTAEIIEQSAARAARPDRVQIEFGLRFSATEDVVMSGTPGEGTLRVLIAYDGRVSD